MTIRVFDPSLGFLSELDDFETLVITRRYLGIETAELLIRADALHAETLAVHHLLHMSDHKVFEILHRTLTQEDKPLLRVTGYGFGKTLAKRITLPPTGLAYDTASGSPDAVVKAYLDHHLIHPSDPDRTVPYLACRANQAGDSITDQSRYKNLLDEVVRVLTAAGRGFYFALDGGTIWFDTYPGRDLTATNTDGNPPALFSAVYDNILDQTFTESLTDAQTKVYVAGQGEGALRTVVEAGTGSGHARFEAFGDARDTDDTAELAYRGLSAIQTGVYTFEARCNPFANLAYETDFDAGDRVTVRAPLLGLSVDRRVTEVREIYQAGYPRGIELVFGDRIPTLQGALKTQKTRIDAVATA